MDTLSLSFGVVIAKCGLLGLIVADPATSTYALYSLIVVTIGGIIEKWLARRADQIARKEQYEAEALARRDAAEALRLDLAIKTRGLSRQIADNTEKTVAIGAAVSELQPK